MEPWNGVRSALSIASEQGNLASVCDLLENASGCDLHDVQNSNLDFADEERRTPISYAAGNGHFETTKLLLKHGASAHLPDLFGRAPLSWAAGGGHLSIVGLLLSPEYNIYANSQDRLGQTPFFWACAKGHSEVVTMMLARNDISPAYPGDYMGNSPLVAAAANGRESVIKILLTYTEVIQDWVVTNWKEEMAKHEWKSYFPGAWTFGTTLAWDYRVSFLPQSKAMAYGHWNIVKLLQLHWKSLDMEKYPIADNVKAEFEEAGNLYNPYLITHVYDPSGTSGSLYPYEQAAGVEVGIDANDDESGPTKKPELFVRGYNPLRANYPFQQAAVGEVGMSAHDEYSPLDNCLDYFPCSQPAAADNDDNDDGHFEAEVETVPASYDHEFGPTNYPYAQSSMSGGEGPTMGDEDHHDNDNNNNSNNSKATPAKQTAITTKRQTHRKRYRKAKAIKNVVHVAKKEEEQVEEKENVATAAEAGKSSISVNKKGKMSAST